MARKAPTLAETLGALATESGGAEDAYGFLHRGHSDTLASDVAEALGTAETEAHALLAELEGRGLAYAEDRIVHGIHWRCWHLTATGRAASR